MYSKKCRSELRDSFVIIIFNKRRNRDIKSINDLLIITELIKLKLKPPVIPSSSALHIAHNWHYQTLLNIISTRCPEKKGYGEFFTVSNNKCMITDTNYPAPDEEMHIET